MLRRLLFSLLLAWLALPATAAMPCHDGGPVAAMAMPADHMAPMPHHRDTMTAAHVCIGCVPPSSWRTAPELAPRLAPEAAPMAMPVRLTLGHAAPPAIPPPRPRA